MSAPRSYFVYGTLRPGGRYWRIISDYVEHYEPGYVQGFALHHLPEGYPAILPSAGHQTFGDLIFIRSNCESLVLDIVDEIEGCNQPSQANLYDRIKVDVKRLRAGGQAVVADIYVFASERADYVRQEGELIESGDWREFVASREDLEP